MRRLHRQVCHSTGNIGRLLIDRRKELARSLLSSRSIACPYSCTVVSSMLYIVHHKQENPKSPWHTYARACKYSAAPARMRWFARAHGGVWSRFALEVSSARCDIVYPKLIIRLNRYVRYYKLRSWAYASYALLRWLGYATVALSNPIKESALIISEAQATATPLHNFLRNNLHNI